MHPITSVSPQVDNWQAIGLMNIYHAVCTNPKWFAEVKRWVLANGFSAFALIPPTAEGLNANAIILFEQRLKLSKINLNLIIIPQKRSLRSVFACSR